MGTGRAPALYCGGYAAFCIVLLVFLWIASARRRRRRCGVRRLIAVLSTAFGSLGPRRALGFWQFLVCSRSCLHGDGGRGEATEALAPMLGCQGILRAFACSF